MTDSAAPPATLDELLRSWPRWVSTSEHVGEDALATRLVVAAPGDALDPSAGDTVLARSAVLRGRPQDAVDLLKDVVLLSPEAAHAADVVAAAARAATSAGVDDYRWLLAHVSHGRGAPSSYPGLRLLAVVAEARGDAATADRAWEELVASGGLRTPNAFARLATAITTRRDREDRRGVATYLIEAATLSLGAPRTHSVDVGPAVSAATVLAARGDVAGAALLVRTLRSLTRDTEGPTTAADLKAAAAVFLPVRVRRLFNARRAGAATAGAVVGVAATLAWHEAWLLVPLLAVVGALLWNRLARLGPFTVAERRAWGYLAHIRLDGASGTVVGRQRDALGALLAVIGIWAGLGAGVGTAAWLQNRAWPEWLQASAFVVVTPVLPVVLLVLRDRVRALLVRRAHRRRTAAEERRSRTESARCACWDTAAIVGRSALYYLEQHLSPVLQVPDAAGALAAVGDGTSTARCPLTGVLWLVVPSGPDEVLIMKGDMSTHKAGTVEEGAFFG